MRLLQLKTTVNQKECLLWFHRGKSTPPQTIPDSKVHGAYMGHTWGRQDSGGPHVGPLILVICDGLVTTNG